MDIMAAECIEEAGNVTGKRMLCALLTVILLLQFCTACQEVTVIVPTTASAQPTLSTPQETLATLPAETTQPTLPVQTGNVIIREVMADNEKLCLGHELDWIELYNAEEFPVDLTGWYLTDDPQQPCALPLQGLQIEPEGYLVITLDDHDPFRLSADGGNGVFGLRRCGGFPADLWRVRGQGIL